MLLNLEMLTDAHTPHILVLKVLESAREASLPWAFWLRRREDPGVVRGARRSLEGRPGSGRPWDSSGILGAMNKWVNFFSGPGVY